MPAGMGWHLGVGKSELAPEGKAQEAGRGEAIGCRWRRCQQRLPCSGEKEACHDFLRNAKVKPPELPTHIKGVRSRDPSR